MNKANKIVLIPRELLKITIIVDIGLIYYKEYQNSSTINCMDNPIIGTNMKTNYDIIIFTRV